MQTIEFRVFPDTVAARNRDERMRFVLWGAVVLLVGIALFAVYGARSVGPHLNLALAWAAGIVVTSAVVGAQILAGRMGLERAKLNMVFVLTDASLVHRRTGWPDVSIGLSDLSTLREKRGWLVVEGGNPTQRIAIPNNVRGFEHLREELAKHGVLERS